MLAYTGIRWGEAIGLRVSSLDALRRRLLIRENAVTLGKEVVVGTPKTHENRSVAYPRFLSEPLALACKGKPRDALVFGDGRSHLHRAGSGKGWFWKAVQRMLGHASAAMTLDTYADLFEDDLDALSERMDQVRAKASVKEMWWIAPGQGRKPL